MDKGAQLTYKKTIAKTFSAEKKMPIKEYNNKDLNLSMIAILLELENLPLPELLLYLNMHF